MLLAKDMGAIEERIKSFCSGLTPEKRAEFIGIVADYTAWQAAALVNQEVSKRLATAKQIVGANLNTLLK